MAIGEDWLARRALEGLLEVMFPNWRRHHGIADPILAPHRLAPYDWVIDAVLAELADREAFEEELGGRLTIEDALWVLQGTWLSIGGAGEETE